MRKSGIENILRKLSFFLIIAAIFMVSADLSAQGDKFSFRMRGIGQGLYGLVDDLYSDLSFNPSYINRYSGTTIFSNISNLQGKSEQNQFSQEETDFFLNRSSDIFPSNMLGAITQKYGRPMGLFWESQGYNISLAEQSGSENFTSLTDGTTKSEQSNIGTDFSGRSLTYIGSFRGYGLSLSYHNLGFSLDYDEDNLSTSFAAGDSSGQREDQSFTQETIHRSFSMPNSMIGFSIGKISKSADSEFSWALGRRIEKITFNANDIFGLFKDPFFGGGEGKLDRLNENDLGFMEIGLKTLFVNVRKKFVESSLNSLKQTSYLFKYERFSLPLSINATDQTISDSLDVSGTGRKTITLTNTGVVSGDGDGALNNVEIGWGTERFMNSNRTMIAFGAKMNYLWGSVDFAFNPGRLEEKKVIDVGVGGDPSEEANSYLRIITDNREQITTGSVKGVFLTIPVGIETKLSSKLTLRLGARSILPLSFSADWKTDVNDDVDELLETDEEISSYIPSVSLPENSFDKVNIDGKMINLDSYHFGAQYQVNDIISIDLLHFAKITELDTWWLSIALKY